MTADTTEINFSLVRGEPQRVEIGGRVGTWYPADGNIKWDYGPVPPTQSPGQLTLEPQEEQLELPHRDDQ